MYKSLKKRRVSRKIYVGKVAVGGDAPISVQSMTNTITADYISTLKQIKQLEEASVDIIRVSCPDKGAIESLKKLTKNVNIPIIADIHFHYKRAIEAAKSGVAGIRINPGNIGSKELVKDIIKAAKDYNCIIRIGVNSGSLESKLLDKYKEPTPDALVESALNHVHILEDQDFFNFKIAVKASSVPLMIESYSKLAEKCDYPLHLGVTEAGPFISGTVKSSIGIGYLLYHGIGDTIRVSLSADPVKEVQIGFDILKSLCLREKGVKIISCPSCSRQGFNVIEKVNAIEQRLSYIKEPITISILGCVVNGIGEASHTNIGIVGINKDQNLVYIDSKKHGKVTDEDLVDYVVNLVEIYIKNQIKK